MLASINSFITALNNRIDFLQSLEDITISKKENGTFAVTSSVDFAEVVIERQSRRFILSLPLSHSVLQDAQRAAVRLRRLRSSILLEYKTLPNEMIYLDATGKLFYAELVLQEIPKDSEPLDLCIGKLSAEKLFQAIDNLENELIRLNIESPNIGADTVYIDKEYTIYPTALHSTRIVEQVKSDNCLSLRKYVGNYFGVDYKDFKQSNNDAPRSFSALYGYKHVSNPFEGLCVVEDYEGRFGYIDIDGVEIVAPQYIWAGDIREGRAEVESSEGMGLIDANGNYIIEPRYQIVDFNPDTSHSLVKQNEKWALYDYEGRKIKDIENFSLKENCLTR